MTTLATDPQIIDYLHRVRAALADLPTETRAELLEDEPAHLAEVLSEGSSGLAERLGPPEKYAAELRAAAGLPPATLTRNPAAVKRSAHQRAAAAAIAMANPRCNRVPPMRIGRRAVSGRAALCG
jgi:uncharacterized membrane protein